VFLLHKVLPIGAVFPFDFGFVPGTRAEDGDPLDIMLLGEEATFTGCLVAARLLGLIEAQQKEKGSTIRNDRLIATAETPKIRPTSGPWMMCRRGSSLRSSTSSLPTTGLRDECSCPCGGAGQELRHSA